MGSREDTFAAWRRTRRSVLAALGTGGPFVYAEIGWDGYLQGYRCWRCPEWKDDKGGMNSGAHEEAHLAEMANRWVDPELHHELADALSLWFEPFHR